MQNWRGDRWASKAGWALILLLVANCGDDDTPVSSRFASEDVRIVSGNNQSAGAGEQLAQPLVVEVVDRNGRPVTGVSVQFQVTSGNGALSNAFGTTGENGRAQARLLLGSGASVVQVTATIDGLVGLPPTFTAIVTSALEADGSPITPIPTVFAPDVEIQVADSVLVADGISTTTVTATVQDSAGNGVPNQTVQFSAGAGTIDATALTDAAGQATANYLTPVNPDGVAAVELTATAGVLSDSTSLRLSGIQLLLSAAEDSISADGLAQTEIIAQLATDRGNPVPDVPVDFAVTVGSLRGDGRNRRKRARQGHLHGCSQ